MIRKILATGLAAVGIDAVLVLPDRPSLLTPGHMAAVAAELILLMGLLWLAPRSWRRAACAVLAAMLAAILIVKAGTLAAFAAFGRPLDLATDPALIPAAWDLLQRSRGTGGALAAVIAAAGVTIAGAWLIDRALRTLAARAVPPATAALLALAGAGLCVAAPPVPGVSRATASLLAGQSRILADGFRDRVAFAASLADDPLGRIPANRLLARLKGRDLLLVFVESYGRVMLDDPRYAAASRTQLDAMTHRLAAAGFGARSAWLTSPTFGGQSWFAHSSFVSGLWIDDQRRYDALVASQRPTLIADFRRAGWRTVAVMPEISMGWPEAAFFGHDALYDAPALGYRGAPFAYVTMPDQYTLAKFQASELARAGRPPIMAEIALVSSHAPWTPLPRLVPWDSVGDGTVFDTARDGGTPDEVWADPEEVRRHYADSISRVLATLESFVLAYGTDSTVLILLGDHQPMSFISGEDAPRDVPVHIVARDPAVLAVVDGWGWAAGMRPDAASPVWKMDAMREKLLTAFSGEP
jgi:hypothetical protein